MAKIKNLYDAEDNGEQIYPRTHENAVIDNDGTPIATKFVKKSSTAGLLKNDGTVDTNGYVPSARKVNGKALSSDITLGASDVGALPSSTTVPSKLSDLTDDATHRLVTDTEKSTWNNKQTALVSGVNIKTINGQSLLGSDNITIEGGGGSTIIIEKAYVPLNYYHQFGTYILDVQNMYMSDVSLYWTQSMVATSDYFYLFFTRAEYKTISGESVRRDHAVCLLYDRMFNFKGYSEITYSDSTSYNAGVCHANDATIYNGYIYLAICDSYAKGVLKVSASTLASNCKSSSHPSTSADKVLSDKNVIAIDYDSSADAFAVDVDGTLCIYNTSFGLVKTVKANYKSTVDSAIGGVTTLQGMVLKDGAIERYDWYHYLSNDAWEGSIVVSVFDVETGELKEIKHVVTNYFGEIEGVCKDPVTNCVWGLVAIAQYNQPSAFSVGYFGTERCKEDKNVKMQALSGLQSSNSGTPIYVKNNYTGYSNGSSTMPYKSVGEAMISTVGYLTRFEIIMIYTGTDYYCNHIRTTDFPLRIASFGSQNPTLQTSIRCRHAAFTIANVNIVGNTSSRSVNDNENAIIILEQDAYLYIENSNITLDSTHKAAVLTKAAAKITIGGSKFTGLSTTTQISNRTSDYKAVFRQYGLLYVSLSGSVTCENIAFIVTETADQAIRVEGWNRIESMLTLTNSLFAINNSSYGAVISLPDVTSSSVFGIYKNTLAPKTGNNPAFKFFVKTYVEGYAQGEYNNRDGLLESYTNGLYPSIQSVSGTIIESNTDLNSILNPGTYVCQSGSVASSLSNTPYTGGNFRLWHIVNTGTTGSTGQWSTQILLIPNEGRMFMRGHTSIGFTSWVEFATVKATSGTTANRPTGVNVGYMYFDTDLTPARPIYYAGSSKWVDATGTEV